MVDFELDPEGSARVHHSCGGIYEWLIETDPSSEFGDEVDVDVDADMDSDAVTAYFLAAKGKERARAEEWEPGSSSVGAGPSSVTSTTASSESIADMINGLGTIPAYISKLERQVAALQKSSEAKARRIKELLDENERLKKDKTRMRAALRLAVADLDDDSAAQGDESGPSGSASQH
ncbi:hypothetical protein EWM64_g3410 [Hericium alpestre]|uniref:Uncharacterized protein n=1 Tax=Hericium alpestre TaxID=135208 RepID=A0A4Z0A2C3_9AGAM|nr:hypothetical protein EWM64_g3410 [Hericium alpestre]